MLNINKKICLARVVSNTLVKIRDLFYLPSTVIVKRNGIYWSLDLKEGIDLAIYTTGGFKTSLMNQYKKIIHKGDVILDIGANVGGQSLQYAQLIGERGKVIALEPTEYGLNKLKTNIQLNPSLAPLIKPAQVLIMLDGSKPTHLYASWPLENKQELHHEHQGQLKSTKGSTITTLDKFVKKSKLSRLNGIRLDVDGNEHDVLMSGKDVLQEFKPFLMMELAPHAFSNCMDKFDAMLHLLWDLDYDLLDAFNHNLLPRNLDLIKRYIEPRKEVDIIATTKRTIP